MECHTAAAAAAAAAAVVTVVVKMAVVGTGWLGLNSTFSTGLAVLCLL